MPQVDNPRLLWHDPKEWMVRVLARLETENELVEQIRIFHGVEEGAAEISYEAACQLPFPKLVIQPKLSDVRGDVRALFRVTELIAKKSDCPNLTSMLPVRCLLLLMMMKTEIRLPTSGVCVFPRGKSGGGVRAGGL